MDDCVWSDWNDDSLGLVVYMNGGEGPNDRGGEKGMSRWSLPVGLEPSARTDI